MKGGTMKHRCIYIDAEFIPSDMSVRGLLSLAAVDNYGGSIYMVNGAADWAAARRHEFLRDNVLPFVRLDTTGLYPLNVPEVQSVGGPFSMALRFAEFFAPLEDEVNDPITYAWCGAQDLCRLHSLWMHNWASMPRQIPHWFQDLEGLMRMYGIDESDLPVQAAYKHHPLYDAQHDKVIHEFILREGDLASGS
jgi:hypothetical protein